MIYSGQKLFSTSRHTARDNEVVDWFLSDVKNDIATDSTTDIATDTKPLRARRLLNRDCRPPKTAQQQPRFHYCTAYQRRKAHQ